MEGMDAQYIMNCVNRNVVHADAEARAVTGDMVMVSLALSYRLRFNLRAGHGPAHVGVCLNYHASSTVHPSSNHFPINIWGTYFITTISNTLFFIRIRCYFCLECVNCALIFISVKLNMN